VSGRSVLAFLPLAATLLAVPGIGLTEGLDGSAALECDLAHASQCDGVAACRGVTLEQIDVPGDFQVDFAAQKLSAAGDERTSPITSVETLETALVLQGHQNGRGWTMVIDRSSGHLSASIADAEGAFVLAGACTAR